ncbi:MAG: HAMP domain-containing histidine kinase, partial [Alphaproteobacteria bacterium]|nr:HAMP domain-containing histidine kinase [Alphaproteobacteria bacterium]
MPSLRLPLFLQTLGLIITSLAVAQTLSVILILNLPPPRPMVYTVPEIANAVRNAEATGNPDLSGFVSHISPERPRAQTPSGRRTRFRNELARFLGLAPDDVIIDQKSSPFVAYGMTRPPREWLLEATEPLLVDRFSVDVRQPSGAWLVVGARPTPFGLDPWQERLLFVLAASLAAVAPLSWMFSRRMAAPIAALAAGAERLGRDPMAAPLDVAGSAEVAAAAAAFNDMQARLRRYVDERMGMLGAIAHDLRTPLTRMRFRIDGLDEPLQAKLIRDIDQMEAMVASAMAFIRDSSTPHERRKLEIASLVETVMDEAALTGADASVDHAERVIIDGDPLALKRLVVNLVDNALKYGSAARARVSREGSMAIIEVDDDGP